MSLSYDGRDLADMAYKYWVLGKQAAYEHVIALLESGQDYRFGPHKEFVDKLIGDLLEVSVASVEAAEAEKSDWVFKKGLEWDKD
jgi:hypothetical protein